MRKIFTSCLNIPAVIFLAIALTGCQAEKQKAAPMPPVTPTQQYTEREDAQANPGSLFAASSANQLFEDNRARRVGDLILVRIVENTKAKHKADTTANRQSGIELGVSAALGRNTVGPLFYSPGGVLSGTVGADPMLSAKSTSDLSGTGETKRENYVTTTIGARVTQVLPNGLMQIEGAREIRVNEETEYMVVTGLVRSNDVLADNSVLSTQLADSSISYYGKGDLADKQRAGWLTRMLDNIWPF